MTNTRIWLIAAVGVWSLAGCQRSHGEVGSESHFLRSCFSDAQCGTLSCHAGVCTSPCASDRQCTEAFGGEVACSGGVCGVAAEQPPRAGTAAPPPAGGMEPCVIQPPRGAAALRCEFETPYEADAACLTAPQPDAGIQIHFGPSSYDSAGLAKWVMQPGEEVTEGWSIQLPNTSEFISGQWEFSARPWLLRAVVEVFEPLASDGGGDGCEIDPPGELVAAFPVLTSTRIARDAFAPENANIVRRLPARAIVRATIHGFNVTDRPLLREFWLNLHAATTMNPEVEGVLQLQGARSWSIPPGDEQTSRFECPVEHDGRLLAARARIQYSTRRLSVTLRRADGTRVPVLNELDANGPSYLFDSVTQNPLPSETLSSAHSGILSFERGDVLEWECRVVNETDRPLARVDDRSGGAECDVIGSTVGGDIRCVRP